jgi:ABC-type transport system involved in cytochrome c biogenesis permease subunit
MNMNWSKFFPGAVVFLTSLYFVRAMIPASEAPDGFHFQRFGRLPVVADGRVKPIDSFARSNLLAVSAAQDYREFGTMEDFKDGNTKTLPAVKWFLDSISHSEIVDDLLGVDRRERPVAWRHRVLRIENDQVLNFLNLELRPQFYRYSLVELLPRWEALVEETQRVRDIDHTEHNLYEAKIMQLEKRIGVCLGMAGGNVPLLIPPRNGGKDWQSLPQSVQSAIQGRAPASPAIKLWVTMLGSYRNGKVEAFNHAVDEYSKLVADLVPVENSRMGLEVFYNHFSAFKHCAAIYGFMFALICLSWAVWTKPLNRAVFWTLVLVAVVHTTALILRMVIQSRPPITNLYSTAIFVGWASIITCLFIEYYFRNGLALAVGSLVGLCTLIIAHYWSLDGDTFEMMQAVLDTNFWLATHVTSMNFGYSATIVAGFMGMAYIVLGLFTKRLANGAWVELGKATYGCICLAMFLSFIGTVLGGIWADQSWGRFWGWDTKENGALQVVLWNALILHARWAGLVKQRGVAVLAVFGNIITAWSWVGTNQLGVGFHAYGSTIGTLMIMLAFDALMFVIMLLGLIPLRFWISFQPQAPHPQAPLAASRSQAIPV